MSQFESVPFSALAPEAPAQQAAKPTNAEKEETVSTPKPRGEGIRVHGHWVIDVKDPDGKLVQHKDFQNSLVPSGIGVSGDQLLVALLSGNVTAGDPAVAFISSVTSESVNPIDPTTYCNYFALADGACSYLATPSFLLLNTGLYGNIRNIETGLTSTANFSPSVSWVLGGNWTVPTGTISVLYVQVSVPTCYAHTGPLLFLNSSADVILLRGSYTGRNADASPASCATSTIPNSDYPAPFPFTSTLVPNAPPTGMPVTPGQIVTVTVTISFS